MNISELRTLTDKLSVIEERRRLALGASGIGIWDWDILNDTLVWDDMMCYIYDIQAGTFGGKYENWSCLVHPEDVGKTNDAINMCLEEESRSYSFKFRIKRGDNWRIVSAFGNCMRDVNSKPTRMVGVNVLEPDFL